MVKHIVLYTLKEGVNKEEAVSIIKAQLEPLVGVIPGLTHMEIRMAYQGGMDYALYSEFESREALKNYVSHPAHLAAKEHFWHFLDTRVCADYEL
ncbi:MAG: Dabb family protein [Oscillospiraceae bacterium]|nr:Dabb family protein [Oscillospiraceae bacterium]